MDHLNEPIDDLRQEAFHFASAEDVRLLYVRVDEVLRQPALETLAAMQWAPGCKRSVFVLDDRSNPEADRWIAWKRALATEYELLRQAHAKAAMTLPEIPPVLGDETPEILFARQLKRVADTFARPDAPTKGVLVVLALRIQPGSASRKQVEAEVKTAAIIEALILTTPSLKAVRWALLVPADPADASDATKHARLADTLGDEAIAVDCVVDPEQQAEEMDDLLGAMAEAGDGPDGAETAGPARLAASAGMAAPAVAPPPHPSDPPPEAVGVKAGKDGPEVEGPLPPLGPFLKGVEAMRAGDLNAAIKLQQEARERCLARNDIAGAVEMDLLLATYAVQALSAGKARLRPALEVLKRAVARAEEAGLLMLGAKAALMLGLVARLDEDGRLAGGSFRRAADLATEVGGPARALAIEALRLAAELAAGAGLEQRAVALWQEALDHAVAMPRAEAEATSAPECARALAKLLRKHKLEERAQEIEAMISAGATSQGKEPGKPRGEVKPRDLRADRQAVVRDGGADDRASSGSLGEVPPEKGGP
jgi:hypothetical protein